MLEVLLMLADLHITSIARIREDPHLCWLLRELLTQ